MVNLHAVLGIWKRPSQNWNLFLRMVLVEYLSYSDRLAESILEFIAFAAFPMGTINAFAGRQGWWIGTRRISKDCLLPILFHLIATMYLSNHSCDFRTAAHFWKDSPAYDYCMPFCQINDSFPANAYFSYSVTLSRQCI